MATPMVSNLKLLSDASSKMVDAMMYHQMICSLICLTNTRTNTCFAVSNLIHFLTNLRHAHLVAKHAVRYLKGIVDHGLKYEANQNINLEGYVDSYWEGSAIDKKNTLGCCFSMRSEGGSGCSM